jgi:hypothetical protein
MAQQAQPAGLLTSPSSAFFNSTRTSLTRLTHNPPLPPPSSPPLWSPQVCASWRRRQARFHRMQGGGGEGGAAELPRAIPLDEVELSLVATAGGGAQLAGSSKAVILMPDGEQLAYASRVDSDVNLERAAAGLEKPGEAAGGGDAAGAGAGAGDGERAGAAGAAGAGPRAGAGAGAGLQLQAAGPAPGPQAGVLGRLGRMLRVRQPPM